MWLVGVVVAACTWPATTLEPGPVPGFYTVGLHLAAAEGLRFGHDLVFTYGPLAFLTFPYLVTPWTAAASFAFTLLTHVALALVVLRVARRRSGWPVAILAATAATTAPLPVADTTVLLVLAGVVWALTSTERAGLLAEAVGGFLSAVELLVKLNDGLLCVVLVVIAAAYRRSGRLRAAGLGLMSFLGSLVFLWVATGNRLADLPGWFRLGAHLVASYGQGMQTGPGVSADLAWGLAILAVLTALGFLAGRHIDRRRVAPLVLAVVLLAFAYFKEGFVRGDQWHTTVFFAALVVSIVSVPWPTPALRTAALALAALAASRLGRGEQLTAALLLAAAGWAAVGEWRPRPRVRLALFGCAGVAFALSFAHDAALRAPSPVTLAAAGTVVALGVGAELRLARLVAIAAAVSSLATVALSPQTTTAAIHRLNGTPMLVAQTRTLVDSSARRRALARYRADWRRQFDLAPALVAALRGRTVDVEPWGAPIAWAYGLAWRPEPLIESYAAYDRTLDEFAAARLAASGAQRILTWRTWSGIDGQNGVWQAPSLVAAEVCNYRVIASRGLFEVLGRSPGRCAPPRRIATIAAQPGAWVTVPPATHGAIVYASLRLQPRTADELQSLLYRPRTISIAVPHRTYKLVPGVAGDRLLMRLPAAPGLPRPRAGLSVNRFRIEGATGRFAVTFYSMRVR